MNRHYAQVKVGIWFLLGLCALFGSASAVRADNPFVVGPMWRGFSQSSLTDSTRGITLLGASSQHDNVLIALLFVENKWRQVQATTFTDASVTILGTGPDTGFQARGNFVPTGDGSYFARFAYQSGGHGRGYFSLLRSFPPGPVVNGVPADPYRTAFPPGPCDGMYQNAAGAPGRMMLTHAPSTESGPPAFFSGDLLLQDTHFNIVGAISGNRLTDGGYAVEMVGQSANFSKVVPCIRVSGELVPAVRPGDHAHLRGTYSVMNSEGAVVDRGSFDMAF